MPNSEVISIGQTELQATESTQNRVDSTQPHARLQPQADFYLDQDRTFMPTKDSEPTNRYSEFLSRIGRPDLEGRLSPQAPWAYFSMEIYRPDLKGQGGLGMLAGDGSGIAKDTGVPEVFVTPFYRVESSQQVERHYGETGQVRSFRHKNILTPVDPEERGFNKVGTVEVYTKGEVPATLDVRVKDDGSVKIVTIDEPNFRELYAGGASSEHRLYQEVALGFGGHKALRMLGIKPSENQQLNEAPTVFAALARLDEMVNEREQAAAQQLGSASSDLPLDDRNSIFLQALQDVKDASIYTNHTLVQAVEGKFSPALIDKYVMPNLDNQMVRGWLGQFVAEMDEKEKENGGGVRLSTIALELAGKINGVSLIHAEEASKVFRDRNGNSVEFTGVTNGIDMNRWGDPRLLDAYADQGVIDEFGLPQEGYQDAVDAMDPDILLQLKAQAKHEARDVLRTRLNQYGEPIDIKDDETMYVWKRRWALYKRPGMVFEDPDQLADILDEQNAKLVLAGRPHSEDGPALDSWNQTLLKIDANPRLRERVHYLVDYDEAAGKVLAHAADISINTPTIWRQTGPDSFERTSTEACATSFMKDILANDILISTEDGGVADPRIISERQGNGGAFEPAYLQIEGVRYEEEVASLYELMRQAGEEVSDKARWVARVKEQTKDFLPVISGARMEADYFNLGFPLPQDLRTESY